MGGDPGPPSKDGGIDMIGWEIAAYVVVGAILAAVVALVPGEMRGWVLAAVVMLYIIGGILFAMRTQSRYRRRGL